MEMYTENVPTISSESNPLSESSSWNCEMAWR